MSATEQDRSLEHPRRLHRPMQCRGDNSVCQWRLDGKGEGSGRILCADDSHTSIEARQSISKENSSHGLVATRITYLGHPRDNYDGSGSAFLLIPDSQSSSRTLLIRKCEITSFHHVLLRSGIGCATAIVWRVHPPDNSEENRP